MSQLIIYVQKAACLNLKLLSSDVACS